MAKHITNRTRLMRRLSIITLFMLAASSHGGETSPPSLTLVDAINHGLARNRAIQIATLSAEETGIAVTEQAAAFALRWSPEGGVSLNQDEENRSFYGMRVSRHFEWGGETSIGAGYENRDEGDGAYARFDIRQPLFRDAGLLVNREGETRAREAALDARRALYLRKMELMIDIVRGYEAVLRYERQVEMDRLALQRLEDLLTLTRVREETGNATRLDTLRVDQQRGEAEVNLEGSRELLELERDDFFNVIGWTGTVDVVFTEPPLLDLEAPALPDALATAFSNRLDYARALDQLTAAERQILIARKELKPDLDLVANYRMTGGQDGRSSTDLAEDSWFAGLTVDPDLNRYERRAGLLRTVSRRDQAIISLADLDYAIERDIKQQTRAYHRARASYTIARRNTELAWKRLTLAESMFRAGQGDNFSVTDAESSHAAAVATELAARAEASLSAYRLLLALGTLLDVPHELKPRT
jgi:outer membrane protein TolC